MRSFVSVLAPPCDAEILQTRALHPTTRRSARLIVPCVPNLSGLFLDSDKLNHSAASCSKRRAANRHSVYLYSGGKINKYASSAVLDETSHIEFEDSRFVKIMSRHYVVDLTRTDVYCLHYRRISVYYAATLDTS